MRLDNTLVWDDEADVGIVARNYLATGTFTGWDGRNLLAHGNGVGLEENLDVMNPPLQYLVAAGSFRLLGQSTWSGRFPFVVAGLIALAVFALIVRRDFRDQPVLWLYALAALGLSVVFLLNIRQCRYYSLGLLFSLLGYDTYRRCLSGGRLLWYLGFAGAMIGLFYSSFLFCAAFTGALAVAHLVFHRRELRRKDLWKLVVAVALVAIATVPYAVAHRIWYRPDIQSSELWYLRKPVLLWWNLRELNILGLPWTVTALLIATWLTGGRRDGSVRRVLEYAFLGIGYAAFVAMLSPQGLHARIDADIRYLLPAVPFLTVLVAMALHWVHQRQKGLGLLLFLVIVTTNVLSIHPWGWGFRWLLPAYVSEVTHDYPTAYGEVVDYLRKNARQNDLVFARPEYTNYPIMFYLGDRVKLCCLLDPQTPLPRDTVAKLEKAGAASDRPALPRLDRVLRASARMERRVGGLLAAAPARRQARPDELQDGRDAGCLLVRHATAGAELA